MLQKADKFLPLVGLLVSLALIGGCKVTPEDIEEWKGTVKGPQKLCAVISSDRYPLELRSQAALALVELDRDIDIEQNGEERAAVEVLRDTLQRIDNEDTRKDITETIADQIIALMQNADRPQAQVDPNFTGPPPHQVRAKDAAFLLANANLSRRATRNRLTDAIVDWYVADFSQRYMAGRYPAPDVMRALGSRAAAKLVDALNARLPTQTLEQVTELIVELGNAETRQAAGERLVAVQREMQTTEFNEWIQSELRSRLEEGQEVSDERLRSSANSSQETLINGALSAMRKIAAEASVGARLVEIAEDTNAPIGRRTNALLALEGNPPRDARDRLARLATNRTNDPGLRNAAFGRLTDLRDRNVLPMLWPLVELSATTRTETTERGMATDVALLVSGAQGASEVLRRLPAGRTPYFSSQELNGYGLAVSQMNPSPGDAMRGLLSSSNWWLRVIALRYLQHAGTADDIARMDALKTDSQSTNGPDWGELNTVGKVAEHAIVQLRERLSEDESRAGSAEGETESEGDGGTES